MRWTRPDGHTVDDDTAAVDRDRLYNWLTSPDAYWWQAGLARDVLDRALDASLNLSVLTPAGDFVGFGRMVTDRATFAYWADVFIATGYRGRGLGGWLTGVAVHHPAVATCRRILLFTRDAHAVYARHGFRALAEPSRVMERSAPDAAAARPPAGPG